MPILNLDDKPENPVERIIWLDGVMQAAKKELNAALQEAYFDARIQGMFDTVLDLRLHGRKQCLAWTRHENEARGRPIKHWNDGH